MRADDLLNAIGEVDDAYIKRAHRRTRWKAVLTAFLTVLVLGTVAIWLMPADYLLMRMDTDGYANLGYADPRSLEQDHWTSLEQTTYENGTEAASTQIRRSLYGGYKLTRTEGTSSRTVVGTVRGEYERLDYIDREDRRDRTLKAGGERRWLTTGYTTDLIGRIDSFYIRAGTAYENPGELLNMVRIEYFETGIGNGWVVRQSHVLDDGTVTGYRTFSYENRKLSSTKDYDEDGDLLSYTDYVYDGYRCTAATVLADGTAVQQETIRYNWLDRIKWKETYDAQGVLVEREVYRYRPWELFSGPVGVLTLFAILSLAATFGLAVWDSRFQRGDRVVHLLTGRQESELIVQVQELTRAVEALTEKLEARRGDEAALKGLTEELRHLNAHLNRLRK